MSLNGYWLPVIKAAAQLHAGDPGRAILELEAPRQYELGQSSIFQVAAFGPMYPVYLRGEAFLLNKQGGAAVAEFQRIVDHLGVIQNFPLGALAHLKLARAYAAQRDRDRARDAYREFLARWKDADPGRRLSPLREPTSTSWLRTDKLLPNSSFGFFGIVAGNRRLPLIALKSEATAPLQFL